MAISEESKLDGRILHTTCDLKILRRLIKSNTLHLIDKFDLYLGIDVLKRSLGYLKSLASITSRAIK